MEEIMERIVTVGLALPNRDIDIQESMYELNGLVEAANAQVVATTIQNKNAISGATYIGKGKVLDIKQLVMMYEADAVVFNDELSGSQIRNLEALLECKIIDRTMLILDIFAQRAHSKEGMLQVQLAQLKYQLPRLIGMRENLSRTGGGIGTRGPGEQKLEMDRRHILKQIHHIEDELKKFSKNRDVNRKKREKQGLPIVALVGYTNAGKSTLMNALLEHGGEEKRVEAKDMLFATLDTTLRHVRLNNSQSILLTDTVGFVSQLPHALVAAFRGTLEEIQYADCILHVVDASSPHLEIQMKTTHEILKDLDVLTIPTITVFNKMDQVHHDLYQPQNYIDAKRIHISAFEPDDIDLLMDLIEDSISDQFKKVRFLLPFSRMDVFNELANQYNIEHLEHTEEGTSFTAVVSEADAKRYKQFIQ